MLKKTRLVSSYGVGISLVLLILAKVRAEGDERSLIALIQKG